MRLVTVKNDTSGYSSVVERHLAKVNVARSNRVTRFFRKTAGTALGLLQTVLGLAGHSVRSRRNHKIDLQAEYPCPCRRRGRLVPITLTEAFGCDRCQQIFVVKESGHLLEQLSTHYPYKRVWYWTGQQWRLDRSRLSRQMLPMVLVLVCVGLFVLLLAVLEPPTTMAMALRLLMVAAVLLLFVGVFWLAYRR